MDRQGCALILAKTWPEKIGKGLMFISLNVEPATSEAASGAVDALRAELEAKGVRVKEGSWGYRLLVVDDPDGLRSPLPELCRWVAGLYFLFLRPERKRYRMLGRMYLIPLLILLFARGRPYYLAPAYPMLLAVGVVWGEQWLESLSPATAVTIRRVARRSMVVSGLATAVLVLPLAPPGSRWWKIADATNQNLNEEFGWREMTDAVIRARDSLQADDAPVGVLAGDARAVDTACPTDAPQ